MNVNNVCVGRGISGTRGPKKWLSIWAMMLALMVALTGTMAAQSAQPRSRITRAISNASRVTLQGTVSKGMTTAPDMGAVEDAKPLRLYMILQRTPEQQAELDNLVARQQQPTAAEYHKWLTPQEVGERFGASQEDIAKITNWLQGQGMTVNGVLNNATFIDFTASAQQVREVFGANLRYYNIGGRRYYANTTEITIPAALQGVVRSMHGLNKLPHHANHTTPHHVNYDAATHKWKNLSAASAVTGKPAYNNTADDEYDITPQDYYTIYNVNKVFNGGNLGANATIAVIEESDIEYGTVDSGTGLATGGDVAVFRKVFGVPGSLKMYVYHGYGSDTCTAPGIDPDNSGEEGEAALDAEWATALAPSAKLIFMSCDSKTDDGIFSSMAALIDNNLADVMSLSYGSSELLFASSDYALLDDMYEQAAAQGQSIIISSGDSGADAADQNKPAPAISGLNVNGLASSPYITVAGGTDFSDAYDYDKANIPQSNYWGTTNSTYYGSTLGYIPETAWNSSCAGSLTAADLGYTGAGACNKEGLAYLAGGSGGFSTHYSVPSYQSGITGYSGTTRAMPDVSMFASSGWWYHALIFCDSYAASIDPNAGNAPCTDSTGAATPSTFGAAGGTSFVAPALAGIGGLLVSADGRQGPLNPALYALAKAQFTASATKTACYSNGQTANTGTTTGLPSSSCTFNDVTTGNNSLPCASGSPNCYVKSGDTYGMLSTSTTSLAPAYNSTIGYDAATGIGTLNVANLLTNWNTTFTSTTTMTASSTSITYSGSTTLTATTAGTAPAGATYTPAVTGSVSFSANSTALGSCTLSGGSCSLQVAGSALAAGSNSISATFAGSSAYPSSTSSITAVTVTAIPTTTTVQAVTATLGTSATLTANVTPTAATGTVTFKLGSTTLGTGTLSSGTATLAVTPTIASGFSAGANTITANYGGDSNYTASSGTGTLTAIATYTLTPATSSITISAGSSGTVTLNLSSTGYAGTVTLAATSSSTSVTASATAVTLTSNGTGTSTLTISPSTSAANHAPAVPWKSGGMMVFAVLLGAPFTLRRKQTMAVLLTALTLSTLGFMVACGGGSGSSTKQARTYTVTVTPTGAGTVTNASAVTITVTVP